MEDPSRSGAGVPARASAATASGAAAGTCWRCPKGHEPYKFRLAGMLVHPDLYIALEGTRKSVTCPDCGAIARWLP